MCKCLLFHYLTHTASLILTNNGLKFLQCKKLVCFSRLFSYN